MIKKREKKVRERRVCDGNTKTNCENAGANRGGGGFMQATHTAQIARKERVREKFIFMHEVSM